MAKTVIGLLDTPREAQDVVNDLVSTGLDRDRIGLMASDRSKSTEVGATDRESSTDAGSRAMAGAGTGAALGGLAGLALAFVPLAIPGIGAIIAAGPIAAALTGAGIGAVAGGLIGGLTSMGVPEEEAHYYAEGVRRGGTLVTVSVDDEAEADAAVDVMKRHGAVDIDERAEGWRNEGWSGRFEADQTRGEGTIPVVEEELAVGKRERTKGGVRVYSHVTERPVEETVNLREERATVERRPVNRPVGAGDEAFREQSFEVNESAEEPVVGKRAKVVEEVSVGKKQTQRAQTVRDTVRKSDVEVERTGAGQGTVRGAGGTWDGIERRRASNVPGPASSDGKPRNGRARRQTRRFPIPTGRQDRGGL